MEKYKTIFLLIKRLNKPKIKLVIEPEIKLKGPFFGTELEASLVLDVDFANSSESFLKPSPGEFIT